MLPVTQTRSENWFDATSSSSDSCSGSSFLVENSDKEMKSTAPQTPATTATPRRSVRFANSLDVQEVPHIKDMSKEDINATWYTPEDFEKIKKSMIVTIRLMMANKPVGNDQCVRGLEFRTPSGAKTRKRNKLSALTAVWNEQVSQWNENKFDEHAISFVYQQQTLKCREQARRFGLHDEKAAQQLERQDSFEDSVASISLDSDSDTNSVSEECRGKLGPVKQKVSPAAA